MLSCIPLNSDYSSMLIYTHYLLCFLSTITINIMMLICIITLILIRMRSTWIRRANACPHTFYVCMYVCLFITAVLSFNHNSSIFYKRLASFYEWNVLASFADYKVPSLRIHMFITVERVDNSFRSGEVVMMYCNVQLLETGNG